MTNFLSPMGPSFADHPIPGGLRYYTGIVAVAQKLKKKRANTDLGVQTTYAFRRTPEETRLFFARSTFNRCNRKRLVGNLFGRQEMSGYSSN